MMRLTLAAVAGFSLLGLAVELSAAQPPDQTVPPNGRTPATAPAVARTPATAPAEATFATPDGSAYVVPSTGQRRGGLAIVDSPVMAAAPEPSLAQENRLLRQKVESLQVQVNVLNDRLANTVSPYDVVRSALREGLPLNGDVAAWICEFGPGHPTLCPSKYVVTSLAMPPVGQQSAGGNLSGE